MIIIGICKDDYSLIIGLGKIIVYGAVILGVLYIETIIIQTPVFSFVFVIGLSIFLICKFINKNNNNDSIKDCDSATKSATTKPIKDENITSDIIKKETISSDFQKELQQNTKTPQQVEDENWLKEKEDIIKTAQNDYNFIKSKLLEKAKNGKYITLNQQKQIIYNFQSSFLLSCIDRKYSNNPSGRIRTRSYKLNEKIDYNISKRRQFDFYLNTIKELANNDNICVKEKFIGKKDSADSGIYINLPYTYTNNLLVRFHQIEAILYCSVEY